ncbi:MAG: hypothetical protein AAF558_14875, partial [Verrucomicrobiota bacterium]
VFLLALILLFTNTETFGLFNELGGVSLITPYLFSLFFALRLHSNPRVNDLVAILLLLSITGMLLGSVLLFIDIFRKAEITYSNWFFLKALLLVAIPSLWFGLFNSPQLKNTIKDTPL